MLNYTEIRQNLPKSLDKVNDDAEIVIVSRSKGKNVVVMDLNEYNAIKKKSILSDLDEAVEFVEKHKAGTIKAKTIEQLLNEL